MPAADSTVQGAMMALVTSALTVAWPSCLLVAMWFKAPKTAWFRKAPPKQAPLSQRCAVVLTSRVRVVCIVMAHGLVMMATVFQLREIPTAAQELSQFMVLLGVPLGCSIAYAAVCPVDAPKEAARYAVWVLLVWAVLCVVCWRYGSW